MNGDGPLVSLDPSADRISDSLILHRKPFARGRFALTVRTANPVAHCRGWSVQNGTLSNSKGPMTWKGASPVQAPGSGGASYRPTSQFGRSDLEKGRARATRVHLATGVDPRFDYLADVYLEDLALLRRVTSLLRKAKARSVAAGDRDLPRCHQSHV